MLPNRAPVDATFIWKTRGERGEAIWSTKRRIDNQLVLQRVANIGEVTDPYRPSGDQSAFTLRILSPLSQMGFSQTSRRTVSFQPRRAGADTIRWHGTP